MAIELHVIQFWSEIILMGGMHALHASVAVNSA